MTISVLQETQNSSQATGTTVAATFTVAAGSYVDVYAAVDNAVTQNGIAATGAASTGLTFTLVDSANDPTNAQRLYHWVTNQGTASAGSLTITVTWSATDTARAIWLKEIGGSSGYNGTNHASNVQAAPGTGANAVTSGVLGTISSVPALISALAYTTISGTAGGVLTSGTGYTQGTQGWTFGGSADNATSESERVTAGTSIAATFTLSQANATVTQAAVFTEAAAAAYGAIFGPGPGISPSQKYQFHVPIRDSSSPNNALTGISVAASTVFGTVAAAGTLAGGDSYSTSILFGQITGAGAPSGNSYAVSVSYGVVGQSPILVGYIPKGGPGVGPSSFFQFSTMELDTTTNLALSGGYSASDSTSFGQMTGVAGALGISTAVSTLFQSSITGVLTGISVSASTDFGQLVGARAFTGVSYSVSTDFGAAVGVTLSLISGNSYAVSTDFGQMLGLTLSQIQGESLSVSMAFGAGIAPPPPGTMRVMAVALGDYKGIFRNVGDVFDILTTDYSPWNVSIVPPGNPVYPLFGWMMAVAPTTPLVDFTLTTQGASTPVQATVGTNQGGQKVYGYPPNQLGEDEVE